jgi:hypothetical protein
MNHISRSHGLIVIELELLLGVDLVESLLLVGVHDCKGGRGREVRGFHGCRVVLHVWAQLVLT